MNPSITLYINNVAYTLSSSDIIKNSIEVQNSLYKELEPTTNKASFKIVQGATIIPTILAATTSIEVEISDGSNKLFTGYLTDNYDWGISSRGESSLALNAEDPGIKLLKKSWISSNALYTFWNNVKICDNADVANSLIHKIAALCGCEVASTIITVSDLVSINIQDKDNKTYWSFLQPILFEYGYVFYFDENGKIALYKIAKISSISSATVNHLNLIAAENSAITTTKRLIQYKQFKITWDEYETLTNEKIFEDITGKTDNYDCDIPLAADAYYPTTSDANTYTYADYSCIDTGKEFIYANSIATDFVYDNGIVCQYENTGSRLKLRLHNATAIERSIRRLLVRGNVVAIKSNNTTIIGDSTTDIYKYEAQYLHEKTNVDTFANTLNEYFKYSNFTYKFKSTSSYDLGSIITLNDDTFTGLNVKVLLNKKTISDKPYYIYEAHGIDTFNLNTDTIIDYTIPAKKTIVGQDGETGPQGPQGLDYDVIIESNNGNIFKIGQSTHIILTARVFLNGTELTDTLTASQFCWRRVSFYPQSAPNDDATWNIAHASGYKVIDMTATDIYARATYFCDVNI